MGLSLLPLVNRLAADQTVTGSIVPVAITGFTVPIAANQRIAWKIYGGMTVPATGGWRFTITVPAGGGAFNWNYQISEAVTPTVYENFIFANAAVTDASAVADDYRILMFGSIENGATAGNVVWNFAQNNAQATNLVLKEGLILEVLRFTVDT